MLFYQANMLLAVCLIISSCTTISKNNKASNYLSTKQLSQQGINYLQQGKYDTARVYFSKALKLDPKDCQLHFLNALTYQLDGKTGNYRLLDLAASGHRMSIKFCPNESWPHYYLGLIEFQKKNYRESETLFYQAMKLGQGKESIASLKGFVKSAQRNGDYRSIEQVIVQLEKLDSTSPLIKELRSISRKIPHNSYRDGKAPRSKFSKSRYKKDRKQAFIDVLLIVSREVQTRNRGVNLLNGLQLQYGGRTQTNDFSNPNFQKYSDGLKPTDFSPSQVSLPGMEYSTFVTQAISIPDVKYNLNIFNNFNEHDKLLSRPTLLARDGKTSTFFSGNQLILGVSGLNTGSIQTVPVGLSMKVTPSFKKDGSIDLDLNFGEEIILGPRSQVGLTNLTTVALTAKSNTQTSVNLDFDETVIISALSEGLGANEEDRTPGLGDLPLIRYAFDNRRDTKRNTSYIVLLTPHKDISFKQHLDYDKGARNLEHFYNKFPQVVSNFDSLLSRLSKSDIYNIFATYHAEFYSKRVLNNAVKYSSAHIDEF